MPTLSVPTSYALAHVLSGTVAAAIGLWVLRRADVTGSKTFAALMGVDVAWVLASAVEVVSADAAVVSVAAVARTVLSLTAVVVWFRFASVYGGRRDVRRDPWFVVAVVGYLGLVGFVLTAVTPSVTTDAPFAHAVSRGGPFAVAGTLFSAACILAGIGRVGSVFLRSRHRSGTGVLLLVATAAAATLPRAAAAAGYVPVPTSTTPPSAWASSRPARLPPCSATASSASTRSPATSCSSSSPTRSSSWTNAVECSTTTPRRRRSASDSGPPALWGNATNAPVRPSPR
ncbi:histidine kinase N-terminal 7TM domain-containing protein [Halogeometricum sp. CBA1124]|uniref:histidine kinase N-terminal 7TM domain-containing protein n=1 Tax=Halogeometricum sp. CBA1124 TaxID=2668071 RepID=UPI00142C5839|nr:hypothetical protein [Halogeometricum sp. CBA1124]